LACKREVTGGSAPSPARCVERTYERWPIGIEAMKRVDAAQTNPDIDH
jgi:hypothetical protein